MTAADRVARTARLRAAALEPTLIAAAIGRTSRIATRARSRRLTTSPASACPTRSTPSTASRSTASTLSASCLGGVRPTAPTGHGRAVGGPAARWQPWCTTPSAPRRSTIDRQDFGGQTTRVPASGSTAGDRWISVAIPRIFEGLPARYGGPNPVEAARAAAAEFKPPADAPPERIAAAAQALRRNAGGAREDPAQRRPRQRRRGRRPVLAGDGPVGGERREDLHVRPCRTARTSRLRATRIVTNLARARVPAAGDVARGRAVRRARARRRGGRRSRSTRASRSASRRCSCRPTSSSASSATGRRGRRRRHAGSRSTSWRRGSRTSSGRACPTRSCAAPPTRTAARSARCSRRRCGRMLRDPKARALAEHFGGQWLQFRALESVTRDRERVPGLRGLPAPLDAARDGAASSSTSSARTAASSTSSTARYSFLNERLARHYGIAGVTGPEFRRVDLDRLAARRRAHAGAAC